jgi:hypothetical protein
VLQVQASRLAAERRGRCEAVTVSGGRAARPPSAGRTGLQVGWRPGPDGRLPVTVFRAGIRVRGRPTGGGLDTATVTRARIIRDGLGSHAT